MPSLGADMEAGTVVKWLVTPGDRVSRGDVVALIETEKATIDAEIFEDGIVEALLVAEGEQVPVGTALAMITSATPSPAAARKAIPPPTIQQEPARPEPEVAVTRLSAPLAPTPMLPGIERSPVVRHLAERLGVDLSDVQGSGLGGTVTRADVEAAAEAKRGGSRAVRASPLARKRALELGLALQTIAGSGPEGVIIAADIERANAGPVAPEVTPPISAGETEPAAPSAPKREGMTTEQQRAAMRRNIASLMSRSKREIPHYYLSSTIDFGEANSWLRSTNLERPPEHRLLSASLFLKATALAAKDFPEMNGLFVDGVFLPSASVHLGVAISLRQGGLIAPAIHSVEELGLDDLTARLKDLVGRARSGRLKSSEMSDPTLTVTNLGDQGVEAVFGVIYPPQVALVGFGKVVDRPAAVGGLIGVRPLVTATVSADHRVTDGHVGARFLAQIDHLLQRPETL